jgi:hypothetical protein
MILILIRDFKLLFERLNEEKIKKKVLPPIDGSYPTHHLNVGPNMWLKKRKNLPTSICHWPGNKQGRKRAII